MHPQPRTWPVLSGVLPSLAPGYTWRPETGQGPWDGLHPGHTVILRPDPELQAAGRRAGGTGKTQLAAAFALQLWEASELDLLVWLDAGSRDRIISGYAQALTGIAVAAPPGQPEAAAQVFLAWLAETGRRWLVVLDGLVEAADADGLWPAGPSGEVIVTTDLPDLGRRTLGASSQLAVNVGAFSPREALAYLAARLNDDPYQSVGSLDLALAVRCLPSALSLAVTYLLDSGGDCRQYRLACQRYFPDRPDGIASDPLAPCWMLAVDRTRQFAPAELAWPAMQLACVLGPAGIPGGVLTSSAACAYATGRPVVSESDQASLRTAFGNLERFGLVSIDPNDSIRTVRISAALAASVRRMMTAAEIRRVVRVAADALCEAWPTGPASPARADQEQALRDCATSLRRCDPRALGGTECHPLLPRIGASLDDAAMPVTALAYWRDLTGRCAELLGPQAPLTLQLRERLASAAAAADHLDESIGWREELIRDLDKIVGPNHRLAITSRASLVRTFRTARRLADAILLGERVAADCDLVLGAADPQTSESLLELGRAYQDFKRYPEAIAAYGRCLSIREKVLGLMHTLTVSARHQLAQAYRLADRPAEAIALYQGALTQSENTVGPAHADTVTAREHLAVAYFKAGQTDEAVAALQRALAEWERVPWATPSDTITARANLAAINCLSGRAKEAIPLYESQLADLEKLRGPDHVRTLRARWNLAAAFHKAKRLPDAVRLGEQTLADCERLLGPGHRETLTTRANLAHAYHSAGQLKRSSAQLDRALRDCERALGQDDDLTEAIRALRKRNLAGRPGGAPIIAPPVALSRWLSCLNESSAPIWRQRRRLPGPGAAAPGFRRHQPVYRPHAVRSAGAVQRALSAAVPARQPGCPEGHRGAEPDRRPGRRAGPRGPGSEDRHRRADQVLLGRGSLDVRPGHRRGGHARDQRRLAF
jgi:tetratricopeptide (TPR) repeat protein